MTDYDYLGLCEYCHLPVVEGKQDDRAQEEGDVLMHAECREAESQWLDDLAEAIRGQVVGAVS